MSDLGDSLTSALRAAPELQTAPSIALGIAQDASTDPTADPAANAQAVAHIGIQQANQQAADQINKKANHHGLVSSVLGWTGHQAMSWVVNPVIKETGELANMIGAPLREVQHEYRAVHDIEARSGPLAALAAGLGITAGAVAGTFLEPGEGTALGGELAAGLVTRAAPGGSFARTTSGKQYQGTYNRETGQYEGPGGNVSIGRDIAGAVGLKPRSTPYGVASGASDFLADIILDPLGIAGKAKAAATSEEGLTGVVGSQFSHAPQGDTVALRAQDLEQRVAKLPTVDRAFRELAGMTSGDIIKNYPKLSALADPLGKATTADQVTDVFRDALITNEMTSAMLPSMSLTRLPFAKVSRAIQDYAGPGQDAIRSVTSLLPTYFDKQTLDLSSRAFDLGDPEAVQGVYRTMRYTQSRDAAAAIAADFAGSMDDPARQLLIYKNGLRQMLLAKGLPEDSQFVLDTIDEAAQRAMGGGEAVYGVGQDGRNLSRVVTGEGKASSLGILQSQQGKIAFPDFNAVTRAARQLNAAKSFYGAADDWMYQHFTQGIFKRLVLLSGGFAQRIALAETIPGALRNGVKNLVESRLAASAVRDMSDEEVGHLSAAVSKVMGGAERVLGDHEKTDFVSNLMADNGGHIVAPAIDTVTPSATVSPVERASRTLYNAYKNTPEKMRLGDQFGIFGHESAQYQDAWQRSLSTISADPASQAAAGAYLDAMRAGASEDAATRAGATAAKDWWNEQPANVRNRMGRSALPDQNGVPGDQHWGDLIMENVKGATHAPIDMGGAPHMSLLANVAAGEITSPQALEQVPAELRPLNVVGRQLLPDTTGTIERIANVGFKKVLDPVINFISREPIYVDEAYRQYQYLKPLIDSGDLLADDARQLAQVRAVNGVLPFIHNTLERSQFSQLARNFMPFWFAQEQAYKRFGRMLADDPGAFRRFQLMISGLHEVGGQQKDPNGNDWLMYPGAGFLSSGAVKLAGQVGVPIVGSIPTSFSGQVKSLNTIFPFAEGVRPGFGPIVGIAGHLIENLFPELTPAVHTVLGDAAASGSVYDQLIPNQTVKNVVLALDPGMRSRSMQNAVINTLQYVDYHQRQMDDEWAKRGGDPADPARPHVPGSLSTDSVMDQQAFVSRIKNQSRVSFLFKALLGAVTPTALTVNTGDWGLRDEYRQLIADKGIAAAHDEFLSKHPDATAYTVFGSDSQAGAPLPSTVTGQDWINGNLDLIRRFPNAGAWFIPQNPSGQFSQGVYNEQMAEHLRAHKSPEQMQKDMWVAAGNDQFYGKVMPAYKQALGQAVASGDTGRQSAIRTSLSNYLSNVMGPQNPVWWDDFKSADRDHQRTLAVREMNQMFSSGQVPDSSQTNDLGALLLDYDRYAQAKVGAAKDPNITQRQLKENWQGYLTQLMAAKPNLQPVITSVFMQL